MQASSISPEELLASLAEAAQGLLFPSESDHELRPFRSRGDASSPAALLAAEGLGAATPVEVTTAGDLFAPVIDLPGDAGDAALAEAGRYRRLMDLLERHLTDVRVYRVGRVAIDVYVVGRHPSGAWLGLVTKVVET
ncbi:nuclease A inhibitor family protein [Sorangium atrum]|uniref:Nuclease A inhibitor family protein n=1 Tax=Sorangium atrum TaxID=2995308 RepID=A0ABT5CCX7_9BACT|nr:nuclease A inhibitor family protein [Sorangium aterium]MDC0683468.1 nuclease A inhibitor family protein [Sorangium aterium]